MKKILFVLSFFALMVVVGCSSSTADNPTEEEQTAETPTPPTTPPTTPPIPVDPPTPDAYSAGDSARENITFDDVIFDKTGEVYVTGPRGVTITGATNTNDFEGVFIAGRYVTLSPYIMGKYEVTQQLYTAVMTDQTVIVDGIKYTLSASPFSCTETGEHPKAETDIQYLRPAENVTWYDAIYFCNKLSEKVGLTSAYNITITSIDATENGHITAATVSLVANATGYRLPTEAEWEFAARGGNQSAAAWNYIFSGADTAEGIVYTASQNSGLDTVGWYKYNLGGTTNSTPLSTGTPGCGSHEVGKKAENSLHIFDMSGNVNEWCYDYEKYPISTGTEINPIGPASGVDRICNGGNWNNSAHTVCARGCAFPSHKQAVIGLRVVRNAY